MVFKKNILKGLFDSTLSETIDRPTKEDRFFHSKECPRNGKLYYVICSVKDNRVIRYIDKEYVDQLSGNKSSKITPKRAAYICILQIRYKNKDN